MKKISILFILLMSMIGLTACVTANANASDTSDGNKTTIKMELDKDYDDTDPFTISLEELKKEDEYVVCLTGKKIDHAALEITFDSSVVQERAKPLR